MAVVFIVLMTPLTRKPTTATIRMQATVSVTRISTSVIPVLRLTGRDPPRRRQE
jgi:hypothetical protein